MLPKERAVVVGVGAFFLAAAATLTLTEIVDVQQFVLVALIVLCFVGGGYVLWRSQHQEPPAPQVQEAEQDETVWPPAPKRRTRP